MHDERKDFKLGVGFKTKFYWYQIGSGDFLHAFFSTVCFNLEDGKWGSRFPIIMNELYKGKLSKENNQKATEELEIIKNELQNYKPDKVVWDKEDLNKKAPWGDNISSDIINLSNYFVTSDGEDFLSIFNNALNKATELNMDLEIKSI